MSLVSCRKEKIEVQRETRTERRTSTSSTGGTTGTRTIKIVVKASANDANTAKVWLDTVGKTITSTSTYSYGSQVKWNYKKFGIRSTLSSYGLSSSNGFDDNDGLLISQEDKKKFFKEHLLSTNSQNTNDAQISSVIVYVTDANGNVKQSFIGKSVQVGEAFQQEFEVPTNHKIAVFAKAQQDDTKSAVAFPALNSLLYGYGTSGTDKSFDTDKSLDYVIGLYANNPKSYRDNITGKRAEDATVTLNLEVLKDGQSIGSRNSYQKANVEISLGFDN